MSVLRRRRLALLAGLCVLAGCAAFGGDNPDSPVPDGVDAAADASPIGDGGAADSHPSVVTEVLDGAPPVVAYAYDGGAASRPIRAVATDEGGRVFFHNQDTRTIEVLGNSGSDVFMSEVLGGNQFIVHGEVIWHTSYPDAIQTLHRFEAATGGDVALDMAGQVNGCAYVDPSATNIYAVDSNGRIVSVPISGGPGTPVTVVLDGDAGLVRPWGVAVTDARLFYTQDENRIIARQLESGAETTIVDGLDNVNCLTLDGDFIYFPTYNDGRIHRVRQEGGEHVILATDQDRPTQIGITGGNLYWNSGSRVMRLPVQ